MSQRTALKNNNKIPENQTYTTNTKLSSLKFENKDIINIIRSIIDNDHDNISTRILKICDAATVKPFSIIFNN